MNRMLSSWLGTTERALRKRLVQPWRQHRLHEEELLARMLTELRVDCVFDVGANDGQFATMLRDFCHYEGQIISFEPTPDVFARLQRTAAADPLWRVEQLALGSHDGTSIFEIHHARQGSSFLPVAETDAHLSGNAIVSKVEVKVARLDTVYAGFRERFGIKRPYLKMDTQGFDLQVFLGGASVMNEFVGLQSELSIVPFYEGAPSWLDSLNQYQKAGFVLTSFLPNNDASGLRLREMDCVMCRPNIGLV
jgi:FkbM family methyltransferase